MEFLKGLRAHFLLLAMALVISSCVKDFDEFNEIKGVEVYPQMSLPLLNAYVGVKDLYSSYSEKALISEKPGDQSLTFIYESRDSLTPQQFVVFPPIDVNFEMRMDPASMALFNMEGSYSNSLSNYVVISTNNKERLKHITVKNGSFHINVTSTFKHNTLLVITYPTITKNGRPLVDTIKANYGGAPVNVEHLVSLEGYDIDLSDGGISYNVIPYLFDLNMTKIPGNPVSANDALTISESIVVGTYSYLEGYLGKFTVLTSNADEALDIFNSAANGKLYIKDPRIRITLQNGVGMPITVKVSNVSIVTPEGNIFPVDIKQFQDTFTYAYPGITDKGKTVKTFYEINRFNSNIDVAFNKGPKRIRYNMEFVANAKEDVEEQNFVFDNNIFLANADFEIPLDFKMEDYSVTKADTMRWEKDDPNLAIEWVKITSEFTNTFPITPKVQMYFTKDSMINGKDSFIVVDSLYTQGPLTIQSAKVDTTRDNTPTFPNFTPTVSVTATQVTVEKYNRLRKTTNGFMVVTKISTYGIPAYKFEEQPSVKIYSTQGLNVRMGVEVKAHAKLNSNTFK